jgi:hypothetical protein
MKWMRAAVTEISFTYSTFQRKVGYGRGSGVRVPNPKKLQISVTYTFYVFVTFYQYFWQGKLKKNILVKFLRIPLHQA